MLAETALREKCLDFTGSGFSFFAKRVQRSWKGKVDLFTRTLLFATFGLIMLVPFRVKAEDRYIFSSGLGYSRLELVGYEEKDVTRKNAMLLHAMMELRVKGGFYLGFLAQYSSGIPTSGRSESLYPFSFRMEFTASYQFRLLEGEIKPYVRVGFGSGMVKFDVYDKTSKYPSHYQAISGSLTGGFAVGIRDIIAGLGIEIRTSIYFPNQKGPAFTFEIPITYSIGWGN